MPCFDPRSNPRHASREVGFLVKFTESQLEQAIIDLLGEEGYPHSLGGTIDRDPSEVLIKEDLRTYLKRQHADGGIEDEEIEHIIRRVEAFSAADLYSSNRSFMKLVADGFVLKREDRGQKDLIIHLVDFAADDNNIYRIVSQLEIVGFEKRIPDSILYINGLPLVVFEFKSAIREEATIHDAFVQLTVRYRRDIPELLKYNALCVISDGVNNKMGSLFAPYEFFYAWRKVHGRRRGREGRDRFAVYDDQGLFEKRRLRDVIRNFIFFPDSSKKEEKIVCRYPQYYAATKLTQHLRASASGGDGKGGTYFGATGCGKSYTMLFLRAC